MNYKLSKPPGKASPKFFWQFLRDEKLYMLIALIAILISSSLQLLAPTIVGKALDIYILQGDEAGLLKVAGQLLALFLGAFVAAFIQTRVMGGVGQRLLFKLRNTIFTKIENMPMAFFNENKAGDLISRINNDTEKLNQFFSQAIMQFVGNAFMIVGAGVSILSIHPELGAAALAPAFVLLLVARLSADLIKRTNAASLQTTGNFSAAVQESLENFKVMIVFNRQDYFKTKLGEANTENYFATRQSELANTAFTPLYAFMGQMAQLIAITFGISLIMSGEITLGILVSFLSYVTRFYDPLRQVASFWGSLQAALSAGDRIQHLLTLESHMDVKAEDVTHENKGLLTFEDVNFSYAEGGNVLSNINITLLPGKTYALVGPTGGGKTTTASLIARLHDPTTGKVYLHGRDIRSYSEAEKAEKIGFILQDAFLLQGTVRENILYGNHRFDGMNDEELMQELAKRGLSDLLTRFDKGLQTEVGSSTALSAGQRQIVAFVRAILREPELLILDEATANIDTVTEKLLEKALDALPSSTTRVIIAHRLNTIANADEIFFVNGGEITPAGSLEDAMNLLLHKERVS